MDKLRVSSSARRIEVNDEGEYITLDLGDQAFLPSLMEIIDDFNAQMPEYQKRAEELDAEPDETEEQRFDKQRKALAYNLEIHRKLRDRLDGVFHDEVCRKVFGGIVPPIDAYAEFFELLTPFIQKYGRERAQKMGKYSADRAGNT